jgi:hypothetical protein
MLRLLTLLLPLLCFVPAHGEADFRELDAPPHRYHERAPQDRFTRLKGDLESGKIALDRTSERAFVESLLAALDVPVSSQMLVFSNTSLQLRLISPRNPRALYFSDDIYIGWVPGGRIEVVGLDPELGAIFYIFDVPRSTLPVRVEQSDRCMNCHAAGDTGHVPGLVVKSVLPGPVGGSLDAFRREQSGHGIPLADRFGGWVVTGASAFQHKGNSIGRYVAGNLTQVPLAPGSSFDFARYPLATSDVLPQLIHEHQVGFVNRVVEAGYRARTDLFADDGKLTPAHAAELDEQARVIVRYALFADEVPLPDGGVQGEAPFKADFARQRHANTDGASLKDFDLRTRLFKNRCSYMLYTSLFQGLPPELKERIFQRLGDALNVEKPDKEFAYLPTSEKQIIRSILKATLPDWPGTW